MSYTYYSAILFKPVGPSVPIVPPEELELFNFAQVPLDESFETWIDMSSPFTETAIPVGTRWIYSVHVLELNNNPECPLKAGRMVAGPILALKDAERVAFEVESSGWFACIYVALIQSDKNRLN